MTIHNEALAVMLEIKRIGGTIWVDKGRLKYRMPETQISPLLVEGLTKHRDLIKQALVIKEQRKKKRLENLVDFLEKPKKSKRGYLACCPAHEDRTPSLSVWLNDQNRLILHCFAGCTRAEILHALGITEGELNRILLSENENLALPLVPKHASAGKPPGVYRDYREAAERYQTQLYPGHWAEKYLLSRGMPLDVAKAYGLGFSAQYAWVEKNKQGKVMMPWKWGRITFPHSTPDGQIINIYGRAIGESDKIPGERERNYFKRAKHLHLPAAKGVFNAPALREETVILTEGAFDALALIVSGYPNACAVFGVSGIRWDWVLAPHVVFAFDNDAAGGEIEHLVLEARQHGKLVSRIDDAVYRDCKDLNEVLIKYGKIDLGSNIDSLVSQNNKQHSERLEITASTEAPKIDMAPVKALVDLPDPVEQKENDSFVQLHLHSQMSTLDGIANTKEIVARAKELGQSAVALTNHGNMVDHIDFIEDCEAEGVKPIVGNEVYFVPDRFYKEKKGEKRKAYHLILLAMDDIGLKNLYRLTSEANETGFHYKPRIDWDLLETYHEGIICTAACLGGYPQQLLLNDDLERARSVIQRFKNIFGDRYYLEIQPNDIPEQKVVNHQFIEWSEELEIPIIATMDSHHLSDDTYELHKMFTQIGAGDDFIHDYKDNYWSYSHEVVSKLVQQTDVPPNIAEEAVKNTALIAQRIQGYQIDTSTKLPHYPIPEGYRSEAEYLRHLCLEGWNQRRIPQFSPEDQARYQERLETELDVILGKGFEGYFLIVWDVVCWARKQGIPTGYGRGSAGGSLVSWLLGIVELDPIKYDLLFERFLNPERASLPDIDLDFSHDHREEVIEYLREKYGQDRVMPMLTLGTMGASMALRDVGRVLSVPLAIVNRVGKRLKALQQEIDVEELKHSILDELIKVEEIQKIAIQYPRWFEVAKQLEGRVRHFGKHASGILIADRPIKEIVPLGRVSGDLVAMADMNTCEKLGAVKFDILGLKTLDVIDQATQMIYRTGKNLDLLRLPEGDKKTYRMLGKAESAGIFQMDKDGAKRLLFDLKPDHFSDLVAINALNRPAPLRTKGEDGLSVAERYIKVRKGKLKPQYLHPDLEPILKETAGQLIYQEQMMRIVGDFAGFTLAERSMTQKAISKKKPEELEKFRGKFIEGCQRNGYSEQIAITLWRWIEQGSSYLFNKSHSASYALMAYQTAYLKAHYPMEYSAALLSVYKSDDKFLDMLAEMKAKNIKILPPLVNLAERGFSVAGKSIIWGLESIKGVGKASEQIVEHRPYQNFSDFLEKHTFKYSKVNKRVILALIKAGAFDEFGERLEIMQQYQETRPKRERENTSLLTNEDKQNIKLTMYQWEQEVFDLSLTVHPLESQLEEGQTGGEIAQIKKIKTKKGHDMAFVTVNAPSGTLDLTVFPKEYRQCREWLKNGVWVIADIKKNNRGIAANTLKQITL